MSGEEFSGLALALGVVRGARSFSVDKLGRLTGVTYPQVWVPGENTAVCRKPESFSLGGTITFGTTTYTTGIDALRLSLTGYSYPSTSPALSGGRRNLRNAAVPVPPDTSRLPDVDSMETCKHGFYAYYDGSDDYHSESNHVSAVVEGYGEVVIGTRGFRAMKARIVALHSVNERALTAIRRNYPDIPLFDTFAGMVSAFPPDGGENAISPDDPDFWTRDI